MLAIGGPTMIGAETPRGAVPFPVPAVLRNEPDKERQGLGEAPKSPKRPAEGRLFI